MEAHRERQSFARRNHSQQNRCRRRCADAGFCGGFGGDRSGEGRLFRFFFAITGACGPGVAIVLQIRERISGSIGGAAIKDDLRHPGLRKIHDVGGPLLVILSATAVLAGMPTVWYFFVVAIGAGLVVAAVMHRAHG